MKIPTATILSLGLLASAFSQTTAPTATIEIAQNGTLSSTIGPAENFTGRVRLDSPFQRKDPSRVLGAIVTFEPGARTAWHTHPLGQTLIVSAGAGWVQQWGGSTLTIKPGDVVWIPPGVKHWHGATATTAMSHVAIVEALDGKSTDWMEKVSDTQYQGGTR